jgi:hypothetical protein
MAFPNQPEYLPPNPDLSTYLLDPLGWQIAPENVVLCDNFDIYDFKQITFSPFGDMLYRGRLFSPKEAFPNLPQQLQAIYHRYYAPKIQQVDFTAYRSNDPSSSSSSNESVRLPPQPNASIGSDPAIADNTDAAGLLGVALNIDGTVPLSQAYKQYEPRGFKLITDRPQGPLCGWTQTSAVAANLSRKRKQIGFSREEVVMYGGLACTPCRPSNLSDPWFTTLFRQENFYNTTQDVYDVIAPALKLAEKFITDPALIGYWSTLAFGNRVIDVNLTTATGICHERLVQGVPPTDEYYGHTLNLLNRMGKQVEYRFEVDDDFRNRKCYGKTPRSARKWNIAPQYHGLLSQGLMWPADQPFPMARQFTKDPWDDFQIVALHPDFLTAARRFSATKNQDLAARLRFNFFFAVNIVHELAHVFELKSSQTQFERTASTCTSLEDFKQLLDPRKLTGTLEAYWGRSSWAEAGGRWEWETFGGRVQPLGGRADGSRGMMIFNADGLANLAIPSQPDVMIGVCIQMGFMEEVQQQSFWARPQHNLKLPKSGAKAYFAPVMEMIDVNDYLKQRDEDHAAGTDPFRDPADMTMAQLLTAAIAQDDPNEGHERPSKRQRLDDPSEATKTREIKRPSKPGRLRQTLIRKFPNKADVAAMVAREEAMAEVAQKLQREREVEESFRDLLPGQQLLDDFVAYSGDDPQYAGLPNGFAEEPYIDPVTKRPEDLTLEDKWKIAEEWVCLAMAWEPIEFQSQRVDHSDWRPAEPFNPDSPTSFTPQALQLVLTTRTHNPGKSWPERRAAEKALYDQKREMASRIAQMGELMTYLGFSRIECHRLHADTGKFPMGMTISNFPAYKPLLDAFRLTQKIQNTGEYVSAVNRGQVSAGATGVGLIKEDSKLNPDPAAAQTAKITDYFQKSQPTDVRLSYASTAPVHPDTTDLAPLTKVPTPEELIRKYEAWVAAGADMRSRPEGVHPSQLLSASLGGSLQTIMPADLAKVVAARETRLEAKMAEQKRREARARADAAELKRRMDRGSGSGSGSGASIE